MMSVQCTCICILDTETIVCIGICSNAETGIDLYICKTIFIFLFLL